VCGSVGGVDDVDVVVVVVGRIRGKRGEGRWRGRGHEAFRAGLELL